MSERGGGDRLTRRRLLELGGGAAGAALVGGPQAALGAEPDARNVVVIVLDNVRADFVRSRRIRTPNLDRLAAQSLRFPEFRPESFPTVPARRTIMTGRRNFPFRGWRPVKGLPQEPGWQGIPRGVPVFTDHLRRAGYRTGYVTDNPWILTGPFDSFRARFTHPVVVRGQAPYRGRPPGRVSRSAVRRHTLPSLRGTGTQKRIREYLAANTGRRGEEDYLAPRVFSAASSWLEAAAAGSRPFALVVDSFDPHEPWDPPRRYLRMYGRGRIGGVRPIQPFAPPGGDRRTYGLSRREMRRVRNLYAAELTMVDAWLGRFLRRLEALGLASNTVVVVTSDHGVLLGERGQVGKKSSQMHSEVTSVPLLIRDPRGRRAGRASDYLASTHDIAPTVLSMLGRKVPRGMDGVDLSAIFEGRRPPRRAYQTACYGNYVSVRAGRWLLISDNRRREPRLYDTRRDPGERRNVAARHPRVVRRLWRLLVRDAGGRPLPHLAAADPGPPDAFRAGY